MFGWGRHDSLEQKARPLAAALRTRYGAEAPAVCRAALTRPELSGERRRVIRMTALLLERAANEAKVATAPAE